jgi:hypothetical protein
MPLARIDSTKGLVIDNQTGPTGNLAPPGWQTTYEVDFTTLTPVASYSNGTATIDGKTWTFSNLSANSSASLNATDGLKIVANAGSNAYGNARVPLSSMGAMPGQNQVLLWGRFAPTISGGSSHTSNVDFAVTNNSYTTFCPWLRLIRTTFAGSDLIYDTNNFVPLGNLNGQTYPTSSLYQGRTTSNTNHDVWVMKYVTSNLGEIWTGLWSSGWPEFSSLQMRGFIMLNTTVANPGGSGSNIFSPIADPNQTNMMIGAESFGGTTVNTVLKFLNLRVQVK